MGRYSGPVMLIYAVLLALCAIVARTLSNPLSDYPVALITLLPVGYAALVGGLLLLRAVARSLNPRPKTKGSVETPSTSETGFWEMPVETPGTWKGPRKGPAVLIQVLLLVGSFFLLRPGNLPALVFLHANLLAMLTLILLSRPRRERVAFAGLSLAATVLLLGAGNDLASQGVHIEWDRPGASGTFQTMTLRLERGGQSLDEKIVGCDQPWLSYQDFDRDEVPDLVITCHHARDFDSILGVVPLETSIVIGLQETPGEAPRFVVLQASESQRSQAFL